MKIREIIKAISRSYLALVAWRILILYIALSLLRFVFCIYNSDLISDTTLREGLYLFGGSLRFDTASLIYVNALWLALSLIPFRFRTNKIYQKVLCWIYMVSNTLFILALNLCDTVYFHYTQKRFTSDEFIFMQNDNNSNLVFTFFIENLHLVLLLIAMVYLIKRAYMCGRECEDQPKSDRLYYPLHTSILVIILWLAVCGLRGGFTRIIRPQTLSNATLYSPDSEKAFMILSNPFCIIRTMGKSLKVTKYFDKETLEAMFSPYHYPPPECSYVKIQRI